MRISLLLLLTALLALPASAQTTVNTRAAAGAKALSSGDVVFGRITLDSAFDQDQSGQRRYYEVYTYQAQANERVTFSVRSVEFVPAVMVADGPGLSPELPNIELSADGARARMDFYAPQMGTYTFAVVAVEPGKTGMFQASLDAQPPMDYAAAYPGGGDPGERYALLVGVNDYPAVDADLNGTINDVTKLRQVLVERYGFRPENVLVLTDADATREHVIEAFRRHLGQAGPGGSAVFYYSGHGTQIPDGYLGTVAGDEDDKADEALVLWGTGGNFGFLIDEELGALADNLGAGHRLLILDNCHSGTGSRGPGDDAPSLVNVRYLPFEQIEALTGRGAELPQALVREVSTTRSGATRGAATQADAGPAGHVLLAAARADQYSIESTGLSADGQSGGIFTYYFVNALKTADPDEPLSALMDRVRVDVMRTTEALKFPDQPEAQEPQAEGTRVGDPLRAFLVR